MWCNLWGIKLNASKTKTMIVSRSCTVHPQLTPITLDGTVLKESADLSILGVTFDAKMTFGKLLRSVTSAAAQRLGTTRKYWQVFHDRYIASSETFLELCPAGFGVLLSSVTLSCRLTP